MLLALMLAAVIQALPSCLRPPNLGKSTTRLMMSTQNALLSELKSLRKTIAEELGLPPYLIYPNNVLEQMALLLPSSQDEVLEIKGVGQKNVRHAKDFLEVISRHKALNDNQGTAPRVLLPHSLDLENLVLSGGKQKSHLLEDVVRVDEVRGNPEFLGYGFP